MTNFLEQLGIREASDLVSLGFQEFQNNGITVHCKLENTLHVVYGGNKWRKLKGNLQAYYEKGCKEIWTFGGQHSNHLYAISAICHTLNIPCHAIVRDSRTSKDESHTMRFLREKGTEIHYVSRSAYRDKAQIINAFALNDRPEVFIIPEGGSNAFSFSGIGELVAEVQNQLGRIPELWVCPAGSGGTAAGLIQALPPTSELIVVPALKGNWMEKTILELIGEDASRANLKVLTEYHFGGYAKITEKLVDFIMMWKEKTGISLDPIYNAKASYALWDLVGQGKIKKGKEVMLINTGGLQGIPEFNLRNALQLPE